MWGGGRGRGREGRKEERDRETRKFAERVRRWKRILDARPFDVTLNVSFQAEIDACNSNQKNQPPAASGHQRRGRRRRHCRRLNLLKPDAIESIESSPHCSVSFSLFLLIHSAHLTRFFLLINSTRCPSSAVTDV